MNSAEIKERDKKNIINTYKRNDPVIISGKNALCYSPEGREYIDFTSGIGVNSLGFCNEEWVEAVVYQAAKIQHTSNLYYNAPCTELARTLTERTGMEKAFFCNSGAEAIETAIKISRKYGNSKSPARNGIMTLKQSFHGRTMAALTATGQEKMHKDFMPFAEGFSYCEPGNIKEAEDILDSGSICGVIAEMIQGEGGVNVLEKDFVKELKDICDNNDIIFTADEVQTGAGRTGRFFAYEHYDIVPDIITFAKGLGGGLPIGGVLTGQKTSEVLVPGDHGSTFGGNPVVCSGANVVIRQMDKNLMDAVSKKGEYIKEKLERMSKVESVTGLGLMIGVKLNGISPSDATKQAVDRGLLVLTAGEKMRLLPPLTIEYEDIDKGINILGEILDQ